MSERYQRIEEICKMVEEKTDGLTHILSSSELIFEAVVEGYYAALLDEFHRNKEEFRRNLEDTYG